MSEHGTPSRRVRSPSPNGQPGSATASVITGRNRAASTSKSLMSVKSNKTVSVLQAPGSKKINTAPPWARHEPPSPDGELPSNPVHTFLGADNFSTVNISQQHLSTNSQTNGGSSAHSSVRGSRPADVISMTSSAPDQLAEQQRMEQGGWWPFSIPIPLPQLPLPLRKNSTEQRQGGSSLISPFQSLFSQTQWLSQDKNADNEKPDSPTSNASTSVADGNGEGSKAKAAGKERDLEKGRPIRRVQWLFDRAQVRKQGLMTEDEMRQPNRRGSGDTNDDGHQDEDQDGDRIQSGEEQDGNATRGKRTANLRLSIPRKAKSIYTSPHSKTPGWDVPWAPAPAMPARARIRGDNNGGTYNDDYANGDHPENTDDELDPSAKRKKSKQEQRTLTLRGWLLHNNAVPLIIRLLNVSFTTATLAVAISIREVEMKHSLVGAVGSSPVLAIIFAPLTLIHVIVAIYLEYFGKPLGLWRTSGKLLHTLLEMLFICMWSAALSLTFDNFFTSRLRCAPTWTTKWWNHLPPPEMIEGQGLGEGGPADKICERQLALICLVFFGLVLYCMTLIISLFRIFEKVKSHGTESHFSRGSRLGMGMRAFSFGRV